MLTGNIPLPKDRQYSDSDSDEQSATWYFVTLHWCAVNWKACKLIISVVM